MSENVIILGAGASKQAGAPLMGDFLDKAEALKRPGEAFADDAKFRLVFNAIAQLQQVHSKAQIDLDNLESVFAAFEMAQLTGRLDGLGTDEINRLVPAIEYVIAKTLEVKIEMPVSEGKVKPPRPYEELIHLLFSRDTLCSADKTTLITFNYDLCLDYALCCRGVPVDYCLEPKSSSTFKLLKLHGSLNWGTCPDCGKTVAYDLRRYFSDYAFDLWEDTESVRLQIPSNLAKLKHCSKGIEGPLVVPPTWHKGDHHMTLQSVWKAAAASLSDAENIIVSGYSLPETDQFFRYLFALGSVGHTRVKRFLVYDPEPTVERKFESLLGMGTKRRYVFKQLTFEQAIRDLPKALSS